LFAICCKTNIHVPDNALESLSDFMTVRYEFKLEQKGRHEVSLFQVKIGLAGFTVKSKATELNSKARTTESKKL